MKILSHRKSVWKEERKVRIIFVGFEFFTVVEVGSLLLMFYCVKCHLGVIEITIDLFDCYDFIIVIRICEQSL